MARTAYTPWHQVVTLREDRRSGDLALSIFAADLYDVAMDRGRSVVLEGCVFKEGILQPKTWSSKVYTAA